MADAPVDPLLSRVDDLAKGWLLELVDQAPLGHAASLLAGEFASTGPRLCEAVIRALPADNALAALQRGGPLQPLAGQVGRVAAATELEDVSRAVDALMAVLWSAIRGELRDPDAEMVSELAERLAHVIEVIRGAALARFASRAAEERDQMRPSAGGEPLGARPSDPPRAPDAAQPGPIAWPSIERRASRERRQSAGAVEFDRRRAREERRAADAPAAPDVTRAPDPLPVAAQVARDEIAEPDQTEAAAPNGDPPGTREVPRRHLDEMSADSRVRSWPGGLESAERPRPVRSEALWIGAIDDEIDRAEKSGAALSLLLVELEDADRVLVVEDPREASMTFRRFAQAVRTVVRRQDILACESDSRAWIIATGSDRAAAKALGARIEHAVRAEPPWRGAPMTISIGLSVLGEDGHESTTLMDVADEARFAATAEGGGVHVREAATEPPPRGGPHRID